jgi:hypothetical protein
MNKWEIKEGGICVKQVNEYLLVVSSGQWWLYKYDELVDCYAYYGWRTSGETDSKVKADKALQKLIHTP